MKLQTRKIRWGLLFLCCWACAPFVAAGEITEEQALVLAQRFWAVRGHGRSQRMVSVPLQTVARGAAGGYYVFAPMDGQGFVVMSGDERLPAVLAYGEGRTDDATEFPPALTSLLRAYDEVCRRLSVGDMEPGIGNVRSSVDIFTTSSGGDVLASMETSATSSVCMAESSSEVASVSSFRAVSPLLSSVRHQEAPYNGMCPYYTYDDGQVSTTRCLVGCVATALEQVMTYYRYPEVLLDTLHGWSTPHYTLADVLPGTPMDWAHVLPDYAVAYTEEEARAVQQVSLYCGMCCRMNYGVNASGASLSRCPETLRRVFGYAYARVYDRMLYTPERWNLLLHNELEHGRPVVYTGHNFEMNGHAFVIDGVDGEGRYHLNWGYGGSYDGYFDLDVLNPFETAWDMTEIGRYEGFFCNQTALFMHPTAVAPLPVDTLALSSEDVTVDSVVFRRQPSTQGYVPVDFYLTSHSADTVTYTFEVMTYLPTDTAVFLQAEYVGLSGATLLPQRSTCVTAYCRFTRTGHYLLGTSCDDVHVSRSFPVTVLPGVAPRLTFGAFRPESFTDSSARFLLPVANAAGGGVAGGLLTYCLFAEGAPDDVRHWTLLNLPPGSERVDTVCFTGLHPGTNYILRARYPWAVVAEYPFTFSASTALPVVQAEARFVTVYTLQGLCLGTYPAVALSARQVCLRPGYYLLRWSDGRVEKRRITP